MSQYLLRNSNHGLALFQERAQISVFNLVFRDITSFFATKNTPHVRTWESPRESSKQSHFVSCGNYSHILSRAEITATFSHVRKLKMKSNIQSYRFLSQKAFVNPMKVARPRKIAELAIRNYYNNCEMKINSSVATEIINYALHIIHEWKKKKE